MKIATIFTATALTLAASACTKPPPNPPGIEQQPDTYHFERNPAQLPTTSAPVNPMMVEDPAQSPVQLPDSQGTVRTPNYVDDVPRR
jgi:hypothetical protein